jgi:outer membrane protein assembly factor BamB
MTDRPTVRRLWMPVLAVGLAVLTVSGLWAWPDREFRYDQRSLFSMVTIGAAIVLLVVWLLFLSGMRWAARLGVLIATVAIIVGTLRFVIRSVEFSGNLVPRAVHFRWETPSEERRAAERGQQGKAAQVPIPAPTPADYPEFRNRHRDGVITGLAGGLIRDWSAHPPQRLWEQTAGGGFAGFVVVGPSAVTLEQIGGEEVVVCYDADTGKERWSYGYSARFADPTGDGPRATPTIADGDVYSFGATGVLVRLDGTTGSLKWTVNTLENNDNVTWAMSGSPLVYDEFVVVNPGVQRDAAKGRGVVAYDRATGNVRWHAGDRKAGYSSPQLATIAGVRQVLVFDGTALGAYDAQTGRELWNHPWRTSYDVNTAQPIVFDDGRVFIASGYGHGCAMLQVTRSDGQWSVQELWTNTRFRCKFTSPVYRDGHVYAIDEAATCLTCLDVQTNQIKWKEGRYGSGQILLVGDVIVVGTEDGRLVLVEANPAAFRELASFPALLGAKNWNHLAIARGRAYLRNHEMMACYELPVTHSHPD